MSARAQGDFRRSNSFTELLAEPLLLPSLFFTKGRSRGMKGRNERRRKLEKKKIVFSEVQGKKSMPSLSLQLYLQSSPIAYQSPLGAKLEPFVSLGSVWKRCMPSICCKPHATCLSIYHSWHIRRSMKLVPQAWSALP